METAEQGGEEVKDEGSPAVTKGRWLLVTKPEGTAGLSLTRTTFGCSQSASGPQTSAAQKWTDTSDCAQI